MSGSRKAAEEIRTRGEGEPEIMMIQETLKKLDTDEAGKLMETLYGEIGRAHV